MQHMSVRHKLEEAAIDMEKNQAYFRNYSGSGSPPWTDAKAAGAFGRAAAILRKALA